jgi:mannobiose 2-epimerase
MQFAAKISAFKNELNEHVGDILNYWLTHTIDHDNGGFFGRIDDKNKVDPKAAKGAVLNARILWSFSAAYNFNGQSQYLEMANRAYQYIIKHFIDYDYGGVYWSVDYKGGRFDDKKQVYAIAFTIYGLSEYYKASGIVNAKDTAIKLYHVLVENCYDRIHTGYFEAFARDWQPVKDLRLSAKDANEKKTMNTHLHVLEAFTNLYKIWPDELLQKQIETLLENFIIHFIDRGTNSLILFFDEYWNAKSTTVSYGHDIEASWLLLESAEVIGDCTKVSKLKVIAVAMAKAAQNGLDADGSLWYEFEPGDNHFIKEKHWWVQAEAMVGFYNAFELSNDSTYLDSAINSWQFVKDKILNKQYGEWIWGIGVDGNPMAAEDKVGIWKCPYHNSRACIEIVRRIQRHNN